MSKKSREEEEESGEQTAFSFPDNARPRRGRTIFTHIEKYPGGKTYYGNCQGDWQHIDLGALWFINWWFPKLTWKDTLRISFQHEDDTGFPSRTMAIKAVIWGPNCSWGRWGNGVSSPPSPLCVTHDDLRGVVRHSFGEEEGRFRGHSWQLFPKKSASGKEDRKYIISRPLSNPKVFFLFVCHKKISARDGSDKKHRGIREFLCGRRIISAKNTGTKTVSKYLK